MAIYRISNRNTGLAWDVHTACHKLEKHGSGFLRTKSWFH